MKDQLKDLDIRLTDLSSYLNISRPTLYKYVELYEEKDFQGINPKVKKLFDYISSSKNITKVDVISYIINNLNENPDDFFSKLKKKNISKKLQELFLLIADNQQYYRFYDAFAKFLKKEYSENDINYEIGNIILMLYSLDNAKELTNEEKTIIQTFIKGDI